MTNIRLDPEGIPVFDKIPDGYVTTIEMAKMLGFSSAVLSKYCRQGNLKAVKIRVGATRFWIVKEKDAMTFIPPNPKRGRRQKQPGRWNKVYLEKIISGINDPYEALANAIVATACRDYQRCLEGGNDKVGEFKSLQKFFRSNWFALLTRFQIDPETMMQILEDEVYKYVDWRQKRADELGIDYESPVLDYEETSGRKFDTLTQNFEDVDDIVERAIRELKGKSVDKPVDKFVDKSVDKVG